MKDYYEILGLNRTASDEEIKEAYRRLAHKYHPSRPGGDESKMKEINAAYEVLSNKEKRVEYDRFGRVFSNAGPNPAEGFGFDFNQGNPFGGFNVEFDPSSFGGFGDLGDIFDAFFEGMGVKQKRRTYQHGSDVQILSEITLEDAYKGINKEIKYRIGIKCRKCNGLGNDPKAGFEKCNVCAGRGEIKENRNTFFGNFAQVKTCSKCFGTGQVPKKICDNCRGTGKEMGERVVNIEILPGVSDSQIIKVKGMGEAGERNSEAGDLYVRIKIKPHSVFERKGDDLLVKKEINLIAVLKGDKIEIPTISGNKISVQIPEGFNLKDNLKIPGEGMPHFGSVGRGSLIVDFDIRVPRKMNPKLKKMLDDLGDVETG